MPTIYNYFGLIFFFWGGDHPGVHIHVRRGKGQENAYDFLYDKNFKFIGLRKRNVPDARPLDRGDDVLAQRFINLKHLHIAKKFSMVIIDKNTKFEPIIYKTKITGL